MAAHLPSCRISPISPHRPTSAIIWILPPPRQPKPSPALVVASFLPSLTQAGACRPADSDARQVLSQLRVHLSLNGGEESKSFPSEPSGGAPAPPLPPPLRSVGLEPQTPSLLERLSDFSERFCGGGLGKEKKKTRGGGERGGGKFRMIEQSHVTNLSCLPRFVNTRLFPFRFSQKRLREALL